MVLLQSDLFLVELGRLYERHRKTGVRSVWVTVKRVYPSVVSSGKKRKKVIEAERETSLSPKCLIRATDGKKKISTQVGQEELGHFLSLWTSVMRTNVEGLKKAQQVVVSAAGGGGGS